MGPPVANDHSNPPELPFTAYMFLSEQPAYTTPLPSTAGAATKVSPAGNTHAGVPVSVYTPYRF